MDRGEVGPEIRVAWGESDLEKLMLFNNNNIERGRYQCWQRLEPSSAKHPSQGNNLFEKMMVCFLLVFASLRVAD